MMYSSCSSLKKTSLYEIPLCRFLPNGADDSSGSSQTVSVLLGEGCAARSR